jgi:hypothetical protein
MILIDLDICDLSVSKDVVEVHRTIVDPNAVVAPGHGVVLDTFAGHVFFNKDDLQGIQVWMDADVRHS